MWAVGEVESREDRVEPAGVLVTFRGGWSVLLEDAVSRKGHCGVLGPCGMNPGETATEACVCLCE